MLRPTLAKILRLFHSAPVSVPRASRDHSSDTSW
jgi:hypothetical protein